MGGWSGVWLVAHCPVASRNVRCVAGAHESPPRLRGAVGEPAHLAARRTRARAARRARRARADDRQHHHAFDDGASVGTRVTSSPGRGIRTGWTRRTRSSSTNTRINGPTTMCRRSVRSSCWCTAGDDSRSSTPSCRPSSSPNDGGRRPPASSASATRSSPAAQRWSPADRYPGRRAGHGPTGCATARTG